MANLKHVAILKQGVASWNEWRSSLLSKAFEAFDEKRSINQLDLSTDLRGADLSGTYLRGANFRSTNLSGAKLIGANLREAVLIRANLHGADLSGALFTRANLRRADLSRALLVGASLGRADLSEADLSRANLDGARLMRANLVETKLDGANLTGCRIYGISVWNISLKGATQSNLVISRPQEPAIQVDNLEVAQFVYLLLNNEKIRHVIDTITSKLVLILGRFTAKRKVTLDRIRQELRKRDYLPVLFDFERPASRDITETVRILADMARFVIADITDAKSIPQELLAIVPNKPSVPVQPLLLASQSEYGMFEHFRRYPWVLEPFIYKSQKELLAKLQKKVIMPAEAKAPRR